MPSSLTQDFAVFVFWEYAITFSDEVEMFWKRRFSGASALFFVNRYVVLSVNILNLIGYAILSDRVRLLSVYAGTDQLTQLTASSRAVHYSPEQRLP